MADVRIDPDIRRWIPPLSGDEVAKLEASIKAEGCRDAIITWDGVIVDGHHRYEICKRLGKPFKTISHDFADRDLAERWVRWNQAGRRNLTDDQRAANAALLERVEAKIAIRERGKSGGRGRKKLEATGATNFPQERSRTKAAKAHRVSEKRVRRTRAILNTDPNLHDQILAGDVTLKDAERKLRDEATAAARTAAAEAARVAVVDDVLGVHEGDCTSVASAHLSDGSVDLIFTDPPYHDKTLGVYAELGQIAARVLKDGASLITYTSHHRIPEVIRMLQDGGLTFFWPLAMVHSGQKARMTEYGIVVHWKPLLWFVKGTFRSRDDLRFVNDLIVSEPEKNAHPWQQGTVEARYYIESLTRPGGLVFDPFCGGGTTAVAARQTDRRWLTCDIDEQAVWIARQRLREAVAA